MIKRIAVSLSILLLTIAPAAHAAGRPSIEHLVGFFDTVVFGSELDKRLIYPVVARWTGPLRVKINGEPTQDHIRIVQKHLQTIRKLTDLKFNKVEEPDKPANVTIWFLNALAMGNIKIEGVDPRYVKALAAPLSCFFLIHRDPPDTIKRAHIVVNAQRSSEATDHCLLEELVQSMGLPNDTNMLRPSIFSDEDRVFSLSRSDEILLRTLYDERMTEGLDRESALNVARRIIADWDQRLPLP